jgi:hypothetical protein
VSTVEVQVSDCVFAFLQEPSDAASPAVVVRMQLASCSAELGTKGVQGTSGEGVQGASVKGVQGTSADSEDTRSTSRSTSVDSPALATDIELQGLEIFSNSSASSSSGVQILQPLNTKIHFESSQQAEAQTEVKEEEEAGESSCGQHMHQLSTLRVNMDDAKIALSFRDIALLSAIARHAAESTADLGGTASVDAATTGTQQFDRRWVCEYEQGWRRTGLPLMLNSHACNRSIVDLCLVKGKHGMPPPGYHKCPITLSSSTLPKGRLLYLCYAFASSCPVATVGTTVVGCTTRCPLGALLHDLEPLQDVFILTEEKGARSAPPLG